MQRSTYVACLQCGLPVQPQTQYCPRCGEPTDPTLVEQLRSYYAALQLLDRSIGKGESQRTLQEVRDEYYAWYMANRNAGGGAVRRSEPAPAWPTAPPLSAATPAPVTASGAFASGAPALPPRPVIPSAPPPTDLFSFRAFLAEQAIALIAYVAGFLLVVATLLNVVRAAGISSRLIGSQLEKGHLDGTNLALTALAYLLLGGGGLVLRQARRLRTFGQALLVMSFVMVPVLALAVYLVLPQTAPVTPPQIVLLAAAYGATMYLLLAWRTRSTLLAYLGWSSAVTTALVVIPALPFALPVEWYALALAASAIGLLLVYRGLPWRGLAQSSGVAPAAGAATVDHAQMGLRRPAMHVALLTSLAAFVWCEALALNSVEATISQRPNSISQPAFAAAATAVTALALLWYGTVRVFPLGLHARIRDTLLDVVAGLIAGLSAQAVAAWASALSGKPDVLSAALVLQAFAELGSALVLRRRWPQRAVLRYFIDGLSLLLVAVGALLDLPAQGWPLSVVLVMGALVAIGIAVGEHAPWWLLAAGLATTLAFANALGTAGYTPQLEVLGRPSLFVALTVAYWIVGLVLAMRARTRRYGLPLYVVALGNALYVISLLTSPGTRYSAGYETAVITTFAILAFLAARIERQPLLGGVVSGGFGALIPLPLLLLPHATSANTREVAVGSLCALTLALAAAALIVRRTQGRQWALAPYAVALWTTILAAGAAETYTIPVTGWNLASILLFAVAVMATLASLSETASWAPMTMAVPAVLAVVGTLSTRDAVAEVVLIFALIAMAQLLRRRSATWAIGWYLAAVICSPVPLALAANPTFSASLLGAYAVVAYLLAAQERLPALTTVAGLYGAAAVGVVATWGPLPTLLVALGGAALGLALRLSASWRWALAVYAVATWAAIVTSAAYAGTSRAVDGAVVLGFAALAYILGLFERTLWSSVLVAFFAGWSAIELPHLELVLALLIGLAALGLVLGRVSSITRSLPVYLAAAVAGLALVFHESAASSLAGVLFLEAGLIYLVAVVERWSWLVPAALLLGFLGFLPLDVALGWARDQQVLSYLGLSWLYAGGRVFWMAWSRTRSRDARPIGAVADQLAPSTTRSLGELVHQWGGVATGAYAALLALPLVGPPATTALTALLRSLLPSLTLLSLAAMVLLYSRQPRLRLLRYTAGELVSVSTSLATAALVPGSYAAILLAPGTYQLTLGALIPTETHLPRWLSERRASLAVVFSLAGSLLVLVPPAVQSFSSERSTALYIPLLVFEALAVIGVGLASRARPLVLIGATALVLAAVRAVAIALASGGTVSVIIATFTVAFMLLSGLAIWLSYTRRLSASE